MLGTQTKGVARVGYSVGIYEYKTLLATVLRRIYGLL